MLLCASVCPLLVLVFVNVEAKGIHSQPQLCALLVFDLKVVDSVHLQVLGDFKIFHHRVLSREEGKHEELEDFIYMFYLRLSISTSIKHIHIRSHPTIRTVWHIPEHFSVFFVPSLYPVLPLLLGQLVLLQDSVHTNTDTMTSPEGMLNSTELFPEDIIEKSNREWATCKVSTE